MSNQKRRDTAPELALRRELWKRGFRYRVGGRPLKTLSRSADIVFPGRRVAIFVDGCFWHACPIHGTQPLVNNSYWANKLKTNAARDLDTSRQLSAAGWIALRVWEHEEPAAAADRVQAVLVPRPPVPPPVGFRG